MEGMKGIEPMLTLLQGVALAIWLHTHLELLDRLALSFPGYEPGTSLSMLAKRGGSHLGIPDSTHGSAGGSRTLR